MNPKPTVLSIRPNDYGVITYNFVGFGVTGSCSRPGIPRLRVLGCRV